MDHEITETLVHAGMETATGCTLGIVEHMSPEDQYEPIQGLIIAPATITLSTRR